MLLRIERFLQVEEIGWVNTALVVKDTELINLSQSKEVDIMPNAVAGSPFVKIETHIKGERKVVDAGQAGKAGKALLHTVGANLRSLFKGIENRFAPFTRHGDGNGNVARDNEGRKLKASGWQLRSGGGARLAQAAIAVPLAALAAPVVVAGAVVAAAVAIPVGAVGLVGLGIYGAFRSAFQGLRSSEIGQKISHSMAKHKAEQKERAETKALFEELPLTDVAVPYDQKAVDARDARRAAMVLFRELPLKEGSKDSVALNPTMPPRSKSASAPNISEFAATKTSYRPIYPSLAGLPTTDSPANLELLLAAADTPLQESVSAVVKDTAQALALVAENEGSEGSAKVDSDCGVNNDNISMLSLVDAESLRDGSA